MPKFSAKFTAKFMRVLANAEVVKDSKMILQMTGG